MKPTTPTLGPCSCKPGLHRDNCPECEGTGQRIDFATLRAQPITRTPEPLTLALRALEFDLASTGPGRAARIERQAQLAVAHAHECGALPLPDDEQQDEPDDAPDDEPEAWTVRVMYPANRQNEHDQYHVEIIDENGSEVARVPCTDATLADRMSDAQNIAQAPRLAHALAELLALALNVTREMRFDSPEIVRAVRVLDSLS